MPPTILTPPSRISGSTKLAKSPVRRHSVANKGPGAQRINEAYAQFCESTTIKALIIGQMLREQRDVLCGHSQNNQHTEAHSLFSNWLEENCTVPQSTAYRWMDMAGKVIEQVLTASLGHAAIEAGCIEVEAEVISFSTMLTAPVAELPAAALEARQLLLDFSGDKTMAECCSLVILEGKEAHSIVRAHNGKNANGAGGSGDRKAFAKFTGTKLGHLTTFFNSQMPKAEQGKIAAAMEAALEQWPEWVLDVVAKKVAKELKLKPEERAARGGGK